MVKLAVEAWMDELIQGVCHCPHKFLGLHPLNEKENIIRVWRPGAREIYIELNGQTEQMPLVHPRGIFALKVPHTVTRRDYRVFDFRQGPFYDPYTFWPSFSDLDAHLFAEGTHVELYKKMGAQVCIHEGVKGVKFTVWAPNARGVSLVGDFDHWNGLHYPMRVLGNSGVWEIFIPSLREGEKYKYEIRTQSGEILLKTDPYGFRAQLRPLNASIVASHSNFKWQDEAWIEKRKYFQCHKEPINIYEVHLSSWKHPKGNFLNYRELAHQLAEYCCYMGFTHIELVSPAEHPLDESWGYQVTGYYAPTSRHGSPEDFQYFVNHMHLAGISVIVDWVPGHFPTDAHALASFDGTALYEYADPKKGFHPHWKTFIFNYGRREVKNFLLANANFWIDVMHVDGLRVDAVASMLYLDYGREPGEWIPNCFGGNENLEAIEFLKHLNSQLHERFPGVLTIAEESTAFSGVTALVKNGGLGFDLKWNMGWMNDTLRYFSYDPIYRKFHHNLLTFGFLYTFSERFALVLSHDEVVHGKKSLLSKMPGDWWQKFANLRLLLSYMVSMPGKNLLFQGGEFGQWYEWGCKEEAHWYLLEERMHRGVHEMLRELNHLYLEKEAFWRYDHDYRGLEVVSVNDADNGVMAYLRKSDHQYLFVVHQFTPNTHANYYLPLKNVRSLNCLFNSDDAKFGGSAKGIKAPEIIYEHGRAVAVNLELPALATVIFEVTFHD